MPTQEKWRSILCVCCQTNPIKSKKAKYCKPCSNFIVRYIKTRVSGIDSDVRFMKKLLEDIKNGSC